MKLLHAFVIASTLIASSAAFAEQPKMEAALASLNQARESLKDATHDKGGYRAKALRAVDAAIAEVKAGIEFDRTHQSADEKGRK